MPNEITSKMVDEYIRFNKYEYDEVLSHEKARTELEKLQGKGCLLYSDCRNCPKFQKPKDHPDHCNV